MGMPFPLGIRLLTGTADQEIPRAWGINGCLSVVSTVLATVIALELGFVRVMVLAAFVYCMTFLEGWTGLLHPEAFRSIHPWQPPMPGTRIRHSHGNGNDVPYSRPLEIVIPPRAGYFSTLRLLASLQRRNSRFALKQSSLRALRCGGRVPRKISNARFRDPIFKLCKGLIPGFRIRSGTTAICSFLRRVR
jgi:hypothetical protein